MAISQDLQVDADVQVGRMLRRPFFLRVIPGVYEKCGLSIP